MRKIVIIPSFADHHLLKCWIPNVIEVIDPDEIIINCGLFPRGPENRTPIDSSFRNRWCYNDTNAGFDYPDVLALCEGDERISVKIMDYTDQDCNSCFIQAISDFGGNEPEVGTIIFPLEPDAFHHEVDKEKIHAILSQLKPGEGIATKWVDFLETQYYTEGVNITTPKYRRFAYCYDNMENYKAAMSGFMSQNYTRLKKIDDFMTFHYPWFQSEPYKTLRFELIHRSNSDYWKSFDGGLDEIRLESESYYHAHVHGYFGEMPVPDKIIIRPSRSDESRYAKFIDISHPKHIFEHLNFVK